jgi:hypothetical protein
MTNIDSVQNRIRNLQELLERLARVNQHGALPLLESIRQEAEFLAVNASEAADEIRDLQAA